MIDIGHLVRSANPIADESTALSDGEFDALLLLSQMRSGEMDLKELTTPVEPRRPRPAGWLVAAGAFAVAVGIGAVVLVADRGGEPRPITVPPATEAVAPTTAAPTTVPSTKAPALSADLEQLSVDYQQAFNAGDQVKLAALFSSAFDPYDAHYNDQLTMTRDEFLTYQHRLYLRGTQLSMTGSAPSDTGMNCRLEYTGPVELALLRAPWIDRQVIDVDEDGRIVRITSSGGAWPEDQPYKDMIAWVRTVDLEEGTALGFITPYLPTDEAAALWLKYAPMWVEAGRP